MAFQGAIGDVVALTPELAYMSWQDKQRKMKRLEYKINGFQILLEDTEGRETRDKIRRRMNDAYSALYIIRRYGGNPQHLPVRE